MAFNISKEKITKYLMEILEKLYEIPSTLNKVFVMKYLFNIHMLKGGSITDHLNEIQLKIS